MSVQWLDDDEHHEGEGLAPRMAACGLMVHTARLSAGGQVFNPALAYSEAPGRFLQMLQAIASHELTPGQETLAQAAAAAARSGVETLNMRALVEAWMAVPELADFAKAVAVATLPGRAH